MARPGLEPGSRGSGHFPHSALSRVLGYAVPAFPSDDHPVSLSVYSYPWKCYPCHHTETGNTVCVLERRDSGLRHCEAQQGAWLPSRSGTLKAYIHPPQPSSGLKLLKINSGGTSQGDLALSPSAHWRDSSLPRTGSQPWAVVTEGDVQRQKSETHRIPVQVTKTEFSQGFLFSSEKCLAKRLPPTLQNLHGGFNMDVDRADAFLPFFFFLARIAEFDLFLDLGRE